MGEKNRTFYWNIRRRAQAKMAPPWCQCAHITQTEATEDSAETSASTQEDKTGKGCQEFYQHYACNVCDALVASCATKKS